jgi:diguanylate cyclase (GGDEF)-like protein/PAS domain S-box-containing protein
LHSLKTRLTLFTLGIFLASIWSLAIYAGKVLHRDMETQLSAHQYTIASLLASQVNQALDDRLKTLERVALLLTPEMMANPAGLQAMLAERPNVQSFFNGGTLITGGDGIVRAAMPLKQERLGVNVADRDYMIAALKEGRTSIGRPVFGKQEHTPFLAMAAPIRNAQGQVIGALVGLTDLTLPNFLDSISKDQYGTNGNFFLIAPQHRLIVTASDKSRIMETLPDPATSPEPGRRVSSKSGTGIFVNSKGVEVLAGTKSVPIAGWYVRVTVPTDLAFAPVHGLLRHIRIATLLLTLLAAVLTWWMLRRLLAPLQATAKTLALLAQEGQELHPLPVTGKDEVSQWISGFNRLLAVLAQRQEKLSQSEQRYRTLTEWTTEPLAVHDGNKLVYVNPACVKMMGAQYADHLLGRSISELLHPDSRPVALERLKHSMQTRKIQPTLEEKVLKLDGSVIDVEIQSIPIVYNGFPASQMVMRDVTERNQAATVLRESEALYRTVFRTSPDAVFIVRLADAHYLEVNDGFVQMFARAREDVIGKTSQDIGIWQDGDDQHSLLHAIKKNGHCENIEIKFITKSDKLISTLVSANEIMLNGEACMLAVIRDISLNKAAEAHIQNLAFSDPLTDLPNRRLLIIKLQQALNAGELTARQGSLLLVDLDDFKTFNETYGHEKGDLRLQKVAKRLSACVGAGDTVARLGGDKFVVLLEDPGTDAKEARSRAAVMGEKILAALNHPYQGGREGSRLTASIGVTLFGDEQEDSADPLKRAELALYQAKAAGRNTLRFFDPDMRTVVSARVALEAGLREALLKHQFLLYYQPQVSRDGKIIGIEALVRWYAPQRGLVSPAEFISLAEETGLILPIGQWVLETACAQLARWADQADMAHLTIAVNVSARQFHQANFVDQVLGLLERSGAKANRLKLELTESLLVTQVEDVITKMNTLKAAGLGFSLDDFGTGYSSLTYLKRLPLDQLKIDQGFVRNILIDSDDAAIAKMVIALADSMGLTVIAEGVETEAQRDFLVGLGCYNHQGHLFSPPLPIEEFEQFARGTILPSGTILTTPAEGV